MQDLEFVAPAIAEDKQAFRKRVKLQYFADYQGESVNGFAQVGHAGCQAKVQGRGSSDHGAPRILRTCRKTNAEKVITLAEQTETERQWAMAELARSDREKIMAYRAQLRNPLRSNHKDFPGPAWRPQWPEGVKRPAV